MKLKLGLAGLTAIAALSAAAPALADTGSCFFVRNWRSWKAPDANTIYLGVNQHDVYRLDLSAGSSDLTSPFVHLISEFRGSSSVCGPLDFDLKVADSGGGIVSPLFVRAMTKLTPEEVAAIPPKDRP